MAGARTIFESLEDEDLELLLRFVLADGSIKDLSALIGVSYPTMRLRLDAVLDRVRAASKQKTPDPVEDYLADLISRGAVSTGHAKRLRDLHRTALEESRKGRPPSAGKESR